MTKDELIAEAAVIISGILAHPESEALKDDAEKWLDNFTELTK